MEDNKQKLRTNNSEDDLICKLDEDLVAPADNHRKPGKVASKSTIKPFKQTLGDVTGVVLSAYSTVRSSRQSKMADDKGGSERKQKHSQVEGGSAHKDQKEG